MLTLHNEFRNKLQQTTELSRRVNNNDKQKILDMMKEHVQEIQDLELAQYCVVIWYSFLKNTEKFLYLMSISRYLIWDAFANDLDGW